MLGEIVELQKNIEILGNSLKSLNWIEPKHEVLTLTLKEPLDSLKNTNIAKWLNCRGNGAVQKKEKRQDSNKRMKKYKQKFQDLPCRNSSLQTKVADSLIRASIKKKKLHINCTIFPFSLFFEALLPFPCREEHFLYWCISLPAQLGIGF